MPSLTCPHCGLVCPSASEECDCGWSFTQARLSHKPSSALVQPSRMRAYLWVAFLMLCTPALLTTGALVLKRHSLVSFVAGLLSIAAWPGVVLVSIRALRSVRRRPLLLAVVGLALADATLVAIVYGYLVLIAPQH